MKRARARVVEPTQEVTQSTPAAIHETLPEPVPKSRATLVKNVTTNMIELQNHDIQQHKIDTLKKFDEWKLDFLKETMILSDFQQLFDLLKNIKVISWEPKIYLGEIINPDQSIWFGKNHLRQETKVYSNQLSISFSDKLFMDFKIVFAEHPNVKKTIILTMRGAVADMDDLTTIGTVCNKIDMVSISVLRSGFGFGGGGWGVSKFGSAVEPESIYSSEYEKLASELGLSVRSLLKLFDLIYFTFMFDPKTMFETFDISSHSHKTLKEYANIGKRYRGYMSQGDIWNPVKLEPPTPTFASYPKN